MPNRPPALGSIRYLLSETDPKRLGPAAAEITFVGRSNVGKSSLLNALCGKTIARVSRTPGRTRLINVFMAGRDRWLVDLPGYGFARGQKKELAGWGPMVENYLTGRPNLRMVFTLIDAKVGPTYLDFEMRDWLKSRGLPARIVATKTDQVSPSRSLAQRRDLAQAFDMPPEALAWVSVKHNEGIAELRAEASALLSV